MPPDGILARDDEIRSSIPTDTTDRDTLYTSRAQRQLHRELLPAISRTIFPPDPLQTVMNIRLLLHDFGLGITHSRGDVAQAAPVYVADCDEKGLIGRFGSDSVAVPGGAARDGL